MKIDLSTIDRENFLVNEHVLAGETCYLVQPNHIGTKFTQSNKFFRSSLWNQDGELISAGLPKFVNWGENPDNFPVPTSLNGCKLMQKLDGSCLLISKYKGQLIVRTRGTVDATKLTNGFEIEILKTKYPKVFDFSHLSDTHNFTYIYEWVSNINKIVLSYPDCPDIYLTACVDHRDYSMLSQLTLDDIADGMGVKRPKVYSFDNIEQMLSIVKGFHGEEGLCVYSKSDQEIHKVKADVYLKMHRFKSNATLENTVDLYFEFGMPDYETFKRLLVEKFDYECFVLVDEFAKTIVNSIVEVNKTIENFKICAEKVRGLSRKDAAYVIMSECGNNASFVFKLLDGKNFDKDQLKKLLWQVLKK